MQGDETTISPMGYSRTSIGRVIGVMFGLFSAGWVLVAFMLNGGLMLAAPFILLGLIFVIGGFVSDLTGNAKADKLSAHMEKLKQYPAVYGEITKTTRYHENILGKYREVKNDAHYKANSIAFDFTVTFKDPHTGEIREAVTDKYSYFALHEKLRGQLRLAPCYDKETAMVYCAPDGSVWVGILYKDPNE